MASRRLLPNSRLRTVDRPEQQYTLAYLGYGKNPEHAELELTFNYGVEKYDLGGAYGHIAIEVADAAATCSSVKAQGGTVGASSGGATEQFKVAPGALEKVHAGDRVTFSVSESGGKKTITKIESQ